MYEVAGVYPAPSFFRLARLQDGSARLTLARHLRTDSLRLTRYLLRLLAYDSVYPDVVTSVDVDIEVMRNQNGPRFTPSDTFERALSDSYSVGGQFLTVTARDDDVEVSTAVSSVPHRHFARSRRRGKYHSQFSSSPSLRAVTT